MYIEKEPEKAVKDKEVKKALDKEPVVDKAKDAKKEELKALPYQDQVKAVSPREKIDAPKRPAEAASSKDPASELKRLFSDMGLPDKLVPGNVESFTHDPKSGTLVIQLKAGFSKQFDKENTLTFDKTISGTLSKGSFSGISGIKRGSASITDISRSQADTVAVRGQLGPFKKTLEFKDAQIPSL